MVMGSGGGISMVWVRVWRKRGENRVFHAEECIYNLHISFSELVSLSEIQLLALTTTFHAGRNFSGGCNCA